MKNCHALAAALALPALIPLAAAAAQFKFPNQTLTVPDGFEIRLEAGTNLVQRPVSIDFDERGRLYVTDSSGSNEKVAEQLARKPHRVLRLEDLDGDGSFDTSTTFAGQLMFPEGAMWLDGSLYVSAPPNIWKLTDTNGDGVADVREEWHQGKTLTGCANDLHGPYFGPDGWIYWCKGAFGGQTNEINGKPFISKAAHIFRARPDHSGMEPVLTGGMDNPVGVAFSPEGERFLAGTFFFQPGGGAGQRDGVLHAIYGGVYGKPHPEVLDAFQKTGDLMPVMIPMSASASASVICYRSGVFGPEFQNNLFVANFNLRNVTRHVLEPDGATFKTTDAVFVSSDNPDFHPTYVLEDADGSVLVVDTGGWYKLCCPTSQLYKPERLGAIYRIRKEGSPKLEDPRGLLIDWANLNPPELAKLLGDGRFCVRARAIHELAKYGGKAIDALNQPVAGLKSIEGRRNEIWAATQIDTESARDFVRRALDDKDDITRSIALHSISLWRDKNGLPQLLAVLHSGQPALQRVAAEALGRIGNAAAVPALLDAAARPAGRILEHSLIYALVEIDDPVTTAKGLDAPGDDTRRAALIALDQMEKGGLQPGRVTPLLGSTDPVLKQTAMWIVSHHNDWGGALAGYFREQLSAKEPGVELKDQLAQFARDPAVQNVLGASLSAGSRGAQLAVLQTITQAALKEAPPAWVAEVARILARTDADLTREAVLAAYSISPKPGALSAALAKVAADASNPVEVRLNALAAQPNGRPLDPGLFDFCLAQISSSKPVTLRVTACGVMLKAGLNEDQLLALSSTLKTDGPLEAGKLLGAFEKSTDETVGMKLIADLREAKARSGLRADRLKLIFVKYSPAVQKNAEPLIASLNVDAAKQASHIDELLGALKDGDRGRGQMVFNSPKATCSACHFIAYTGGHVGPELTKIGQVRTERDLLEAIVYPSASFVRGFEPVIVTTKSGDDVSGIVKKDAPDEIILVTGPGAETRIARNEITNMRPGTTSVMPEGLTAQMTGRELSDLIAYLRGLR